MYIASFVSAAVVLMTVFFLVCLSGSELKHGSGAPFAERSSYHVADAAQHCFLMYLVA